MERGSEAWLSASVATSGTFGSEYATRVVACGPQLVSCWRDDDVSVGYASIFATLKVNRSRQFFVAILRPFLPEWINPKGKSGTSLVCNIDRCRFQWW